MTDVIDTYAVTADELRTLIASTGLSQAFARDVAGRDPLTMRRWLAGETIPDATVDWLERLRSVVATDATVAVDVSR